MTISSASRRIARLSSLTSPTIRTARPGPGERMLVDEVPVHAELEGQGPDLVLEQLAERLDELELEVLGEAADVVVRFDGRGRPFDRIAFDDVGIDRPLGQVLHPADLASPRGRRSR